MGEKKKKKIILMLLSNSNKTNNKKFNSLLHSITSQINKPYLIKNFSIKSKYGDDSIYFDLNDIENTTGSWDMYGQDDKERYPEIQEEFFRRAAQSINRRESMLAFCSLAGIASIISWGVKGSVDTKLPITIGPQKTPEVGPRGRI